ncbi:hypothetical protein SNE40_013765 [Patella caerulea]|uniref:Uncharacterized protein n=1 Tax=Patella caerulea TaxID=87958 RepID=A0AAN8JJY7_PATCE
MDSDREVQFRDQLYQMHSVNKRVLIRKDDYQKIVRELLDANSSSKKSPQQYYLLKKYEVLECGDVTKLIRKGDGSEEPVYFASIEHSFDIIQKTHIATGHGGRDKIMKELSKKYANITQEAVTIFKSSCVPC